MRGFRQRVLLWALGGAACAFLSLACPAPKPPVNPSPDADASPPPPASVTCEAAAAHAHAVCPAVIQADLTADCHRIGQAYAARLVAAADCPGVRCADPGTPGCQR